MLLVCPNCGAQYEVDAEVIPPEGRDVQCSSCGETWWATREPAPEPEPAAASEPEPAAEAPQDVPEVEDAPEAAPAAESWFSRARARSETAEAEAAAEQPEAEPEPAGYDAPEPAAEPGDFWVRDDAPLQEDILADEQAGALPEPGPEEDEPEPMPVAIPRRPLDPGVADVLRQEAQREAEARRAEGAATGEAALPPMPAVAQAPAAAARPVVEPGSAAADLPNIDEINSTLSGDEDFDEEELLAVLIAEERRRMGFRRGLGLMLLLAGAIALSYVFAPAIADSVPALRPMMESYVAAVNDIRTWLYSAALNASNAIGGGGS